MGCIQRRRKFSYPEYGTYVTRTLLYNVESDEEWDVVHLITVICRRPERGRGLKWYLFVVEDDVPNGNGNKIAVVEAVF